MAAQAIKGKTSIPLLLVFKKPNIMIVEPNMFG